MIDGQVDVDDLPFLILFGEPVFIKTNLAVFLETMDTNCGWDMSVIFHQILPSFSPSPLRLLFSSVVNLSPLWVPCYSFKTTHARNHPVKNPPAKPSNSVTVITSLITITPVSGSPMGYPHPITVTPPTNILVNPRHISRYPDFAGFWR